MKTKKKDGKTLHFTLSIPFLLTVLIILCAIGAYFLDGALKANNAYMKKALGDSEYSAPTPSSPIAPNYSTAYEELPEQTSAFPDTTSSAIVDQTQEFKGAKIKVKALVFTAEELKVILDVDNGSDQKLSMLETMIKVKAGSDQYRYQVNLNVDAPRLDMQILSGVKEKGEVLFAPLKLPLSAPLEIFIPVSVGFASKELKFLVPAKTVNDAFPAVNTANFARDF